MENGIKVYAKIAQELTVLSNPNAMQKYIDLALSNLRFIEREFLPSGSGFDNGCTICLLKSTGNKIVIKTAFHHMNDNGYYDGWSEHDVTITPSLAYDHDMKVSGRDKRDIKNYILDAVYEAIDGVIINKSDYEG